MPKGGRRGLAHGGFLGRGGDLRLGSLPFCSHHGGLLNDERGGIGEGG